MALVTTSIDLSTTPVALISTATTWANTKGASVSDKTAFSIFNNSGIPIRISGSASTAATGFPVGSSATFNTDLMQADTIFAFTTASTGNVIVIAGRQ